LLDWLIEEQETESGTTSEYSIADSTSSNSPIEAVPLQVILPSQPLPADLAVLALPVPDEQPIPAKKRKCDQDNGESSKGKGKRQRQRQRQQIKPKGKARARGKARQHEDDVSCPTYAFEKLVHF
jgi:hypothetical protein